VTVTEPQCVSPPANPPLSPGRGWLLVALDLRVQTRFCARPQLGTPPPQPGSGQRKGRARMRPRGTPPAPDCPGWDGVPGPQPTFPHPQTSPLGGQPPASVPPWQSRGVGEAERETERGVRDRRTDGDGGEGRRRVGRHSHQSMADGATATAHRRKLLGPRATASPRPTPLTRSVPRGSSQGRSQSRTGTLDPSVPPGPLRPGRSPRLTSPPQRPRRSPRAGERDEQG